MYVLSWAYTHVHIRHDPYTRRPYEVTEMANWGKIVSHRYNWFTDVCRFPLQVLDVSLRPRVVLQLLFIRLISLKW